MIQLTIKIDDLLKKLKQIEGRIDDARPFLKMAGEYIINSTKKNFDESGRPRWANNVFGTPTLVATGSLRNSMRIADITKTSVTIEGGQEGKSAMHNFGYKYIPTSGQRRYFFWKLSQQGKYNNSTKVGSSWFVVPKRQFMKLQPEDEVFLANKFEEYVVK